MKTTFDVIRLKALKNVIGTLNAQSLLRILIETPFETNESFVKMYFQRFKLTKITV